MTFQLAVLGGRCSDGFERGHGVRIHARVDGQYRALCGAEPGRRSAGWFDPPAGATAATCPRCLAKLDRDREGDKRHE